MENPQSNFLKSPVFITFAVILVVLCCCCVLAVVLGGVLTYETGRQIATEMPEIADLLEPPTATPPPPVELTRTPPERVERSTLSLLQVAEVPLHDAVEAACRLKGVCNLPPVPPAAERQVGETQAFWVTNTGTNENFQVNATLRHVSEHAYFWVHDEVDYDQDDLEKMVAAFETRIYPTNQAFFGSEESPGADGDARIYILYASGIGWSISGYFSSADALPGAVHEYSNTHEMFVFNADNSPLGSDDTHSVLAHEYQHMIHWNVDRNEAIWMNEGFSVVAETLNGYSTSFDTMFIVNPDLQLNDWPNDPSATVPHYGASFLFLRYFLDRFGEEAARELARSELNGLESVDDTLRQINATDAITGRLVGADDLFQDWTLANVLLDESIADGRYAYPSYPEAPLAFETETIDTCPLATENRTVHQYGTDYIRITCPGEHTLVFTGATQVSLLPQDPYSGRFAFWSNKGDQSNMTLTRRFDLSGVSGPVELSYRTWYDIEADYDQVYVEVSRDGLNWEIVTTPSGTDEDPTGNSLGWAYTGASGGWLLETIDLSRFAGEQVWVRFEQLTDGAVNGEGFLLDDVSLPAAGYFTDFEADDGGWEASGFVRVENVLPQTFRLALILDDGTPAVQYITLAPDQTAVIPLSLGDMDEAVLVISGVTRYTRSQAVYSIEIK